MNGIERKSILGAVQDIDEKGRLKMAVSAFGNVDAHKDIIVKGAYAKTLKESFNRVRWFLNHKQDQQLGVPIAGEETDTHLVIDGKINLNKQIGRDIYEDYKMNAEFGRTLEHSIGAFPIKVSKDKSTGIRTIHEYKLMEFSTITSWGANENTPLLGLKSLDDISGTINFMEYQLKNGKYSDEKFELLEKSLKNIRSLLDEPSKSGNEPLNSTLSHIAKTNFLTNLKFI
jgi:HK97 family phage prohead protease